MSTSSISNLQEATSVDQLHNYGYYIKEDKAYYALEMFEDHWRFDVDKLAKVKSAPIQKSFKLIVFQPGWTPQNTSFFAENLDQAGQIFSNEIAPKITPVNDELFELEFEDLLIGQLLAVRDYGSVYFIGLGNIAKYLPKALAESKEQAYVVLDNVKQAIKAFPAIEELKSLLPVWEDKKREESLQKTWLAIEDKFKIFEAGESRGSKMVYGQNVLSEINYFISLGGTESDLFSQVQKTQQAVEYFIENPPAVVKVALDKSLLSKYIKAYHSTDIVVTIAEVGDEFLVRFKGINNEMDGKVLKHTKSIQNPSTESYILQTNEITGDNWNTFSIDNNGWGSGRTFVYPPKIERQIDVYPINLREKDVNDSAEKMFEDYSMALAE